MSNLSSENFRQMIGNHAAGVVVVSTEWNGAHHGVTVISTTSVSLSAAIVLICLNKNSLTVSVIRSRGGFCLNLLDENQETVSRRFVRMDGNRFADIRLQDRGDRLPLIVGAACHLVCKLKASDRVGDHNVVYGEAVESSRRDTRPLLYHKGRYCRLAP